MEDKERLAKIETAIEGIEKLLAKLESKIDHMNDNMDKKFVPRLEQDATNKRVHERIDDLEKRVVELEHETKKMTEKQGKLPAWAAALMTFLITLIGAILESHFFK